jgi:hypothetical protein
MECRMKEAQNLEERRENEWVVMGRSIGTPC